MSGLPADGVRVGMETIDGTPAAQRFSRLRAAFHRLLEVELGRRQEMLSQMEAEDPAIGAELRALLDDLDETDLLADASRAPPSRLGPFRLLHRIGRGGMGEVFLAERVEGGFEQQVALKLVRDAALSPDLTRRFLRERQILARLAHPNIAGLIDGGFGDDGRPWLAMEYVQGERITDWCNTRALDTAARVRLFLPLCDAVQFAHRNLIVHRDLKPANLMVDAEGRPKLLDFGIARLLESDSGDPTQTLAAMTPAYAAPEQRVGGVITTATDVYQLGVVLSELVAPLPRDIAAAGRSARAFLRGDLGRVIAKAMAEFPADRYASVALLAEDLSDWLARRPLRSGIGSRRERLRKTLWQWRWPLALLGTAMLAIGTGALLAWREARVAQASAAAAKANFGALLSVIGSANPGRYAGREPLAGELLIDASARLQRDFAQDPGLLQQALGEIGHGLMNLGRGRDAEPVLIAALDALRRESGFAPRDSDARRELGLLKLLVLTYDDASQRDRAVATAARISRVAALPEVPTGLAMDVLASGAATMGRVGDFATARALFAQAERLDASGASMTASQRENVWRQRGWLELRAMALDQARHAFMQSRAAQDAAPDEFSSVRRAELDLLLAETALAGADAGRAAEALEAARPAMLAEYPQGHFERAHFNLQEARLALLRDEPGQALALVVPARQVLQAAGGEHSGRSLADRVARVAQARQGDCSVAGSAPDLDQRASPREHAEQAWMHAELLRACKLTP